MESNYVFYSVLIYIIIILLLVLSKPDFVYDNNKKKYREFGRENGQTLFTLPIVAIFLAIILALFFSNIKHKTKNKKNKKLIKYVYVPIDKHKNIIESPSSIQSMTD